jgi:hypothetical protein
VADQEMDRHSPVAHELGRTNGIGHLDREGAVTPLSARLSEPEIVEAEHPEALGRELLANASGRRAVLAQSESVSEDTPTSWSA